VTERIRFYTNVYKLPLHSPLLTARTLASAWALAPGRIAIGVGLGWNVQEFEAVGVDFATRGPRTDETLEILRRFRPGEWVEHHGRFYDIPRLQQAPAIPEELRIFVGGDSPAALRRAARAGDGWCSRAPSVEAVVELIPRMQDALAEAGRSSEGFEIFAMCPEATDIETVDRLSRAGVTEVQLWPWLRYDIDAADLEGKLDSVRRFARDVIEPLRSGAGR
jgi:alkanesulfonate monooxygenase SsuD/methylene tetrahydromethanopterin reductase-like flavin-dependent oxidoreductase (luciferase family)